MLVTYETAAIIREIRAGNVIHIRRHNGPSVLLGADGARLAYICKAGYAEPYFMNNEQTLYLLTAKGDTLYRKIKKGKLRKGGIWINE